MSRWCAQRSLGPRPLGADSVSEVMHVLKWSRLPGVRPDTVTSAALLREARLRAGLSQLELADRTGKGRVQIGRWEIGTVAPSLDTLLELIHACGLDLPLMLVELPPAIDDEPLTELPAPLARAPAGPDARRPRFERSAMSPSRKPGFDPRAIMASLERSGANYIVIGGLARVLRGPTRSPPASTSAQPDRREPRTPRSRTDRAPRRPDRRVRARDHRTVASDEAVIELSTPFGELKLVLAPAGVPRGFVALRGAASKENLGHGLQPYVAAAWRSRRDGRGLAPPAGHRPPARAASHHEA